MFEPGSPPKLRSVEHTSALPLGNTVISRPKPVSRPAVMQSRPIRPSKRDGARKAAMSLSRIIPRPKTVLV